MSNAKRFLGVVLAIIMVCSTLVIGASAAYNAYKDAAIVEYDALDKAVLSPEQYASAAMDEVDRMLDEEQLKFTRADIVVGDIDLTSLDSAMDDIYAIVNGPLFSGLGSMLGDLGSLTVNAFRPEAAGGVRRGTAGKSDLDIIYAVIQFLYDNKGIFTSFVAGNIDLGSVLPSLVDISDYTDINKLLKGLLYEATYYDENGEPREAPADIATRSFDTMVQDLINRLLFDDLTMDGEHVGLYFQGLTNISQGSFYDKANDIIKVLYNKIAINLLNTDVKKAINGFCGVEYIEGTDTVDEENTELNGRAALFNLDYTIPEFSFTSEDVIPQLNNLVKSIADAIVNPAVYVWQGGANTMFKTNVINLAKAVLTRTGDDFFASYIEVADEAELNAMSDEELVAYALRAIINGSVDEMYIPAEATTVREFGYYALKQLLATAAPELDFSSMNKNSTDTLIIMAINYAIYSVKSNLDMGLSYVNSMAGVDQQIKIACQYAIKNYGGLLNGINFGSNESGWTTLNNIIFSIIPANWLPASANDDLRTFLIDCLIENILDLDFNALLSDVLTRRSGSELNQSIKQVVLNRVVDIVNVIFPGAFQHVTTIDALATNASLSVAVNAIFTDLYNYRVNLAKSILPTLCNLLDLTNEQEFEFPQLTYDKMGVFTNGNVDFNIKIRNSSTGINTGYTDADGAFHQDSLYTYQIISATSSVAAINVTAPTSVAAGRTENIRINGSLSNDVTLKVTLKYNVLTETGDPLTASPIEEDIYCYLTKTLSIEDNKATSTAAGGFSVTDGPINVFARSMGDVTDITLTAQNTNATPVELSPFATLTTGTQSSTNRFFVDESSKAWVRVRNGADEKTTVIGKVGDNAGVGRIKVFETTEEYDELTSAQKNEVWESIYTSMTVINSRTGAITYPKAKYELGVTNGTVKSTNVNAYLYLYKDFGLSGMVNSELGKHRQSSAYTDSDKWDAYQTALYNAVGAVYSPFTNTFAGATGKCSQYEGAANALKLAILNLDGGVVVDEETEEETVYEGCAASAGVESLQAIINQYNPSNRGLEYDDPNYNYFAVADYEGYTYFNYRDEYRTAQSMIDRATIPNEEGEVAVINELDKMYAEHRLALYGSRLLPVAPTKTHLAAELANPTRTNIGTAADWSAESWAEYQRALAFATSVNNTALSALKQSKINKALDKLLEAEKKLCVEGEAVVPSEASFDFVEPTGAGELTLIESEDGIILTGIQLGGFEPEEYFDCVGCHVEFAENDSGFFSTGAVVEIVDDATGQVIETYIVSVYSDVDGDADLAPGDVILVSSIYGGSVSVDSCVKEAADVACDGDIDVSDLVGIVTILGGSVAVDYVNREYN